VPVTQVIGLHAGERLHAAWAIELYTITVLRLVMTYASVSVDQNTRHYSYEERNVNKHHNEILGFTTFLSHGTDMYANVEYINSYENRYEHCATGRSFHLSIFHLIPFLK
jgi:hypothetical protein